MKSVSFFSLHLASHAPSRLLIALVAGLVTGLLSPARISPVLRWVLAWDVGASFYMEVILFTLLRHNSADFLKKVIAREDQSRWIIHIIMSLAAFVSLIAIGSLLSGTKGLPPFDARLHLGLGAATVLISWSIMHMLFAVHYAHSFYGDAQPDQPGYTPRRGLNFPGDEEPVFSDFLYFSFVVGMTCQVSDIAVTRAPMRRLTLMHGFIAFFFNTVVLALSVNIGASLVS